jgi:hypothetical protein
MGTPVQDEEKKKDRGHPRKHEPDIEMPDDLEDLHWAAGRLGICWETARRLASVGELPGAFRVGKAWRVSVPTFERAIHGTES